MQLSNCVPFSHPIEALQHAEPVPSSDFLADPSSRDVWWLNQDIATDSATMFPEDPFPQANLQSGSEEETKNAIRPGEFQELKQAVDALGDRFEALEEAVPKLQDG